MSSTEEQLISFFAYSMFIYPVTSYLVSPKRNYSRWKGAIYAVLFLSIIFFIQIIYENKEKGPNHYQLLNVARFDSNSMIKKAYKRLSLELHPDKNKSPTAQEDFQRVKTAYDVLSNTEYRHTYNRLGDAGVKINMKSVIDLRHLVLQLIVYYGSSAIFAFLMTVSEPSGEAMEISFVGLSVMLFLESLLVIKQLELPTWFFPHHTSHDIVSFLHRLFPAFMNGSRSILGAFHEDPKTKRENVLQEILDASSAVTLSVSSLVQTILAAPRFNQEQMNNNGNGHKGGIMEHALRLARKRVELSPDKEDIKKLVKAKAALVSDAVALKRKDEDPKQHYWIAYLLLFLLARYMLFKTSKKDI